MTYCLINYNMKAPGRKIMSIMIKLTKGLMSPN